MEKVIKKKVVLAFYLEGKDMENDLYLSDKARVAIREELNLDDNDVAILQIIDVEELEA
jgi:hypothetical protein